MLSIILLILILSFIVLIHELGHFLFAKLFKVHIYEFSIGMGPLLKTIKGKDGVDYSIRAFPIGGYVSMAGEVYEDNGEVSKEDFMCNKPWYQKILILAAGVIFNFILAIIILFFMSIIWGAPNDKTVVQDVTENSAIEEAGIKPGDTITHVDGKRVSTIDELQMRLVLGSDKYEFTVRHENGKTKEYIIKPEIKKQEDGTETKVFGVQFSTEINKGLIASLKYSVTKFATIINVMAITIGNLFTGNLSLSNLSGPVGMYSIVDQSAAVGISSVIYLIAFLSINVGVLNILPIPAFDGGRIFFLVIEKITGKKINPEVENVIHLVFFGLLIILMLYVTFNDVLRIFN